MRVERLELIGFKSFADKTVFNFHPGTTAIVGPNGCGKSNVVDAFKWVLGEQSAKSLRGGSMEDVIFAGSATKKTKGMAEVTLVLSDIVNNNPDNPENDKKTTITEIAVTRRLYRSGESEYLLNKVPCRLKDIRNMFLDTGLELKAYSILEQGRMDQILNSKPQDRRFLIEEVAGVMKYKVRRAEALNKLEASKSNLLRLQDIITEVKRQINTIDRHARKAEKYKKLFEEIRDIDLRVAKRDSTSLQDEIASLTATEDSLKGREAEAFSKLHAAEALIEEKKRLCVDNEKQLNEVRMKLYSLEKEVMEDEGKIALLKSDCDNLRGQIESLNRQEGELVAQKGAAVQSIKEIADRETAIAGELADLDTVLADRNSRFSESEEEIKVLEHELEAQRRNLFNKAEEVSNMKNEISHISLSIENISRRAEKSSQDINSLNDSLTSIHNAVAETGSELRKMTEELAGTRAVREGLVAGLRDGKTRLSTNEEALHREREELAAMGSKLDSLIELDQIQRSAVDENVKALCQVADIFETTTRYETAIEAALGDKLNAAVLAGPGEITKAVQYIREQRSKRSGFIAVNPGGRFSGQQGISGEGIVGGAMNFVTVKEGYQSVAEALLNDVVLIDNLDTAYSLRETHAADAGLRPLYYVTLDGEVLEPSGVVFGGSGREVLKVKRLIKELEGDISVKKEKIAGAERAVSAGREEIISIENEIISTEAKINSAERYCHTLEVKLANFEEENDRVRKKHEYISLEINDDYREKDNLGSTLEGKESEHKRLEGEKQDIEDGIRSVQETIAGKRELLETFRSELTGIKLDLASSREKMESFKRENERLNKLLLDLDRKMEEMSNERIDIEQDITGKEQEVAEKQEALKSKIISAGEQQGELSKITEILEARTAELSIIEKQQRSIAAEVESVRTELNHVEMKKMELSMKLNYMKEDVRKTYSIEIETAEIAGTVGPEEEERLARLKEQLQEIGPVSLGTLDEYEELKTRYEFLTRQRDDLQASIDALQDTIQKINKTTQSRLLEAFNALNEKFREVFTVLFGKGRAELHLTDEGSILDAGIEIVAQPPGKRLQNLMLLSGGEKALTALSLLFAGFMIKPTPLCLLDEVDAPLDESNTERFINLMKELSKGIQFITITHNRRTMEAANYIYGVTMEEQGSSKVISMHLAEAV